MLCPTLCASPFMQNWAASTGATICSNFLQVSDRSIPKSTLSQHFRALREAGLVRSERHGVEMRNVSRCKEIEQRFPGIDRRDFERA